MDLIQSISAENDKLKKQIKEKSAELLEISKKHHALQWNVKKSDFVAFCEEKERESDRKVIKELMGKIEKAEDNWSGLDKRLEESKAYLEKLTVDKTSNSNELQRLREMDYKNEVKLNELHRTVHILQNRNAAMKLKLKKQKQEFDDQIQILSSQLAE